MSESKHTPGPWHYGEPVRSHKMPMVWDELGSQVADCRGACSREYDESLANAHLIAAAPELLDQLRIAVARVQLANEDWDSILSAWLSGAVAAIAKAEWGAA